MSAQSFPQMSVVIVKPDHCPTIRETVEHLRKQTGIDRIELVIVTSSSAELGLTESEREGFWAVRVVEVGESFPRGRARALGVHQAVAPVVAFIEDHAYPATGMGRGPPEGTRAVVGSGGTGYRQCESRHHHELGQFLHPLWTMDRRCGGRDIRRYSRGKQLL